MQQQCSNYATSMQHQCSNNAATLQQHCSNSAATVQQQCDICSVEMVLSISKSRAIFN